MAHGRTNNGVVFLHASVQSLGQFTHEDWVSNLRPAPRTTTCCLWSSRTKIEPGRQRPGFFARSYFSIMKCILLSKIFIEDEEWIIR